MPLFPENVKSWISCDIRSWSGKSCKNCGKSRGICLLCYFV